MRVLEQMRSCRASRRTVERTGASRATASKKARTSPVPSSSVGTTRARMQAAAADAGRAQLEQCLGSGAVVPRHQGDGGDGGKLAHEARDRRQLVAAAGVDRE